LTLAKVNRDGQSDRFADRSSGLGAFSSEVGTGSREESATSGEGCRVFDVTSVSEMVELFPYDLSIIALIAETSPAIAGLMNSPILRAFRASSLSILR
jgi:hypothetical protein